MRIKRRSNWHLQEAGKDFVNCDRFLTPWGLPMTAQPDKIINICRCMDVRLYQYISLELEGPRVPPVYIIN